MRIPSPGLLVASIALAALAGCPKPPPPPPPPQEVVAPPPAPPKCESVVEKCESKPDTRARVANAELVFSPVPGWVYAQQSSATLAQAGEAGAALAMLGVDVDPKDVKKAAATKDAALGELVKQLALTPLKKKISWKEPKQSKPVGGFTLQQWQADGVRAGKKGDLLVVAVQVSEAKVVVGLAFVPEDDKSDADVAMMKAIESLGKPQ